MPEVRPGIEHEVDFQDLPEMRVHLAAVRPRHRLLQPVVRRIAARDMAARARGMPGRIRRRDMRCLRCGGRTEHTMPGTNECARCGFIWAATNAGPVYFMTGEEVMREAPDGAEHEDGLDRHGQ